MQDKDFKEIAQFESDSLGIVKKESRISHPRFGKGTIDAIFEDLTTNATIYRIRFDNGELKSLHHDYAKLTLADQNNYSWLARIKNSFFSK